MAVVDSPALVVAPATTAAETLQDQIMVMVVKLQSLFLYCLDHMIFKTQKLYLKLSLNLGFLLENFLVRIHFDPMPVLQATFKVKHARSYFFSLVVRPQILTISP